MPNTKESGTVAEIVQETLDRAAELNRLITSYNDTESLKRRGHPLFWNWERKLDRVCLNLADLRDRCSE